MTAFATIGFRLSSSKALSPLYIVFYLGADAFACDIDVRENEESKHCNCSNHD